MVARSACVLGASALVATLVACSGDDGAPPPVDASAIDASATDASAFDASPPEAGARDSGPGPVADATADAASARCALTTGLAPGDHDLELDFAGERRRYHVHVPPSYDGSVYVPLVLDFHGFMSNAGQQILLSGMNDKSDAEGFVAVHPEGFGVFQSWNAGACCGDAAMRGLDDVGLVRAIVAEVSARVCVDRRRVFATGMSNGGFLSHRLACEAADVIAAIAPVSGVLGIDPTACAPSRPIPVMHFHGAADLVVPYGGSTVLGFPSAPATFAGWAMRNACIDAAASSYSMGAARCDTHDECAGGVEVTLCTVEGLGHWWPGAIGGGTDLYATEAMWDFFVRHPMP